MLQKLFGTRFYKIVGKVQKLAVCFDILLVSKGALQSYKIP